MCRRFRIVPFAILRLPLRPDPSLFGGTWTIVLALVVLSLMGTCSARGQNLPPAAQRTASWYANNPTVLDLVTALCRDNPGRLRHDPDCINAAQGRLIVAQRDAERAQRSHIGPGPRRLGDLTPPSSPRYWRDRPEELREKLAYCDRMTAEEQSRFFCAPARAAAAGTRRL